MNFNSEIVSEDFNALTINKIEVGEKAFTYELISIHIKVYTFPAVENQTSKE